MISTRALIASYVILLLSLAVFWYGLHRFPMWALYTVFSVGFLAALVTAAHPWLKNPSPAAAKKIREP